MELTTADSGYPSIFTAFERDLGLRLDKTTGRIDVLVIDNVSWPTPN